MSTTLTPIGYSSPLSMYETQTAIGTLKRIFEDNLSKALCLKRV
ncbi:MAG TPA: aspartate--ammonia ligase, partial [Clostridiales bacterium]|nr:aspartate--ammonia ligase [Clostridiales bacterium]